MLDLLSLINSFGTLAKLYDCSLHHFTTSLCIMYSIDSFVNFQSVGRNLKGELFDPTVWGGGYVVKWGSGIAHSIALLKSVSARLADPYTTTNTALEVNASSSGKITIGPKIKKML